MVEEKEKQEDNRSSFFKLKKKVEYAEGEVDKYKKAREKREEMQKLKKRLHSANKQRRYESFRMTGFGSALHGINEGVNRVHENINKSEKQRRSRNLWSPTGRPRDRRRGMGTMANVIPFDRMGFPNINNQRRKKKKNQSFLPSILDI